MATVRWFHSLLGTRTPGARSYCHLSSSGVAISLPRAHSVPALQYSMISNWAARHVQYISALMKAFYGHFKDGTGGSRDYRFLAGMHFLKFIL